MGAAAGCCREEPEFNPDGTEKATQTPEQVAADPVDARKAARDGDTEVLGILLRRMRVKQINSGASKSEVTAEDVGNTALHYAAQFHHLRGVRKLLWFKAEPNVRNRSGHTPLHLTLQAGKTRVAAYLLDHSADPNITDDERTTVVLAAALAGRRGLVRWLLEKVGAKLDLTLADKSGNTLVSVAARYGWHDLVADLIPRLPAQATAETLACRSKDGDTALGWVLKFGSTPTAGGTVDAAGLDMSDCIPEAKLIEMVTQLLQAGAPAATPCCREKIPPVSLAAATGSIPVLKLLLAKGALLTATDAMNRTPLHFAAAKGWVDMVAELLTQGLLPTAVDTQGNTALHLAASRGQLAVLKLLMEKVADPRLALVLPNKAGMGVYHMALMGGPSERAQKTVQDVMEQIGLASINTPVDDKTKLDTPLLLAIASHQSDVVRALLSKGTDANTPNMLGELPIARNLASVTLATADQDAVILGLLMEAGAKMDGASEAQHPLLALCKSPLSSFSEKALKVLKAQLPAGGKLEWDVRDALGRGPLALAALNNNVHLVRYLVEEEKVPVDVRDSEGATPLMSAAQGASVQAMKVLLNCHADPCAKNKNGMSVLWHCLLLDKVETLTCAALLLMMGAAPEKACFDITGESLLHRAVRYGAEGFIRVWSKFGGDMTERCTLPPTADDMPGADFKLASVEDYLDQIARANEIEDEEDEGAGDVQPLDADEEDMERMERAAGTAGAIAEGVEGWDAGVFANEVVAFQGPTSKQLRAWNKRGVAWWDDFWSGAPGSQPPPDDGLYDLEAETGELDGGELDIDDLLIYNQDQAVRAAKARRVAKALRLSGPVAESTEAVADDNMDGEGILADLAVYMQDPQRWHAQKMPKLRPACPVAESLEALMPAGVRGSTLSKDSARDIASNLFRAKTGSKLSFGRSDQDAEKGSDQDTTLDVEDTAGNDTAVDAGGGDDIGGANEGEGGDVEEDCGENDEDEDGNSGALGLLKGQSGRKRGAAGAKAKAAASKPSSGGVETTVKSFANGLSATSCKAMNSVEEGGLTTLSGFLDKGVVNNDPYFKTDAEGRCTYSGQPLYMHVDKHVAHEAEQLQAYAAQIDQRLAAYKDSGKDDKALVGPELRERNIVWWNSSLPPAEYYMKPGQWKAAHKKSATAIKAARLRRPAKPGTAIKARKKTAWFGMPDLPDRPELMGTTALIYAVRLGRAPCVKALLEASLQAVNMPDANGYTPLCYAMYMLANDRLNVTLQQIADQLLATLPHVNVSAPAQPPPRPPNLDGSAAPKRDANLDVAHNVMDPLVCATLLGDVPRLTHMVLRCRGALNMPLCHMPSISAFYKGLFDKMVSNTNSMVRPLHIAILHKKLDFVKLLLDLGADVDLYAEPPNAAQIKAKLKAGSDALRFAKALPFDPLNVVPLGLIEKFKMMKKWLSKIEIPGFTKPHPWLSPLHLAGRLGLAEVCQLLITRGAAPSGGPVTHYARMSPLEEALGYARQNYQKANTCAPRKNWKDVNDSIQELVPAMSMAAAKEAANQHMSNLVSYLDPINGSMKAAALAAKVILKIVLAMMKRPVSHVDPAVQAAHVLLLARAPLDMSNTQTSIAFRDLLDNDHQWTWVGLAVPLASKGSTLAKDEKGTLSKFKPAMAESEYMEKWRVYQTKHGFTSSWPADALVQAQALSKDGKVGAEPMAETGKYKEYSKLKKSFVTKSSNFYFTTGVKVMHKLYVAGAKKAADQVAATKANHARQAMQVRDCLQAHKKAAAELLAATATARQASIIAAAAERVTAWALQEEEPTGLQKVDSGGLVLVEGSSQATIRAASTGRKSSRFSSAPPLSSLFQMPQTMPLRDGEELPPAASVMTALAAEKAAEIGASERSLVRFENDAEIQLIRAGMAEGAFKPGALSTVMAVDDNIVEDLEESAEKMEKKAKAMLAKVQKLMGQDPEELLADLQSGLVEDFEEKIDAMMSTLEELNEGLATLLDLCGMDDMV